MNQEIPGAIRVFLYLKRKNAVMDKLAERIWKDLINRMDGYSRLGDLSGGSTQYNTAIHEAGHGVIAYRYNIDIEYLKINKSNPENGETKLVKIERDAITEPRATSQIKVHSAGIISQHLYTDNVKREHCIKDAINIRCILDFGLHTLEDLGPLFDKTKEDLSKLEIREQIEILAKELNTKLYLSGKKVYSLLGA
ncbi:hypothetical protein ACFLTA_08005 [Bacteroidota bacterium]